MAAKTTHLTTVCCELTRGLPPFSLWWMLSRWILPFPVCKLRMDSSSITGNWAFSKMGTVFHSSGVDLWLWSASCRLRIIFCWIYRGLWFVLTFVFWIVHWETAVMHWIWINVKMFFFHYAKKYLNICLAMVWYYCNNFGADVAIPSMTLSNYFLYWPCIMTW